LGSKFKKIKIQLNEKQRRSVTKACGSSFSKTVLHFVAKQDKIVVK